MGGAEQVLLRVHQLYPEAPIYTSKYSRKGIDWFKDADVRTGWLQVFPAKMRRLLGPLRQRYFNHLDLSDYDVIISVTGAEAKSVKKGNAVHFCYCHVPTQYYWQMYDDYIKNPGFGILNPIVRFFFKLFVRPLRKADFKAAQRPDYFITISEHAKAQIEKYYQREAIVIHPPVEVEDFKAKLDQEIADLNLEKPYIAIARQVNWKRLDLCIKACLKLKKPLTLIGEGPEHERLVKLAGGSTLIKFVPPTARENIKKDLAAALPLEEDRTILVRGISQLNTSAGTVSCSSKTEYCPVTASGITPCSTAASRILLIALTKPGSSSFTTSSLPSPAWLVTARRRSLAL